MCLLGSQDGTLFVYDPLIVESNRINRYNSDDKQPFYKNQRPELVKWIEPQPNQNASKFAVAWEDGSMYIYEKDVPYDPKEDYKESVVEIRKDNGKLAGKAPTKNFCTKAEVVQQMQKLVEDFDFQ